MTSSASNVLGLTMTDDYEFLFRCKNGQKFGDSQTEDEMPFSTWADSERGWSHFRARNMSCVNVRNNPSRRSDHPGQVLISIPINRHKRWNPLAPSRLFPPIMDINCPYPLNLQADILTRAKYARYVTTELILTVTLNNCTVHDQRQCSSPRAHEWFVYLSRWTWDTTTLMSESASIKPSSTQTFSACVSAILSVNQTVPSKARTSSIVSSVASKWFQRCCRA
jgi:hypothetical protein